MREEFKTCQWCSKFGITCFPEENEPFSIKYFEACNNFEPQKED